ncbi:MAG TPA: hypothetical protein VJL38_00025 [Patescibacteria group bacterium]|nr:hypothetical protein [Patescibacteria group bacterium]
MFADILRIFTAVLTFNNRVVPHLNVQVYYRVLRLARIALGIIVGGFVLNLIGLKEVNLLLAILFTVGTAVVWFQPRFLIPITEAGVVVGAIAPPTIPQTIMSALELYVRVLGHILLWGSLLLFIMGTLSFRGNPMAIFVIVAGFILLALIGAMWGKGNGVWGRRMVKGYVVIMIIVSFLSLISGPRWVKIIGIDPNGLMEPSVMEEALHGFKKSAAEAQDKKDAEKLRGLTRKVNRGENLTNEEKAFVRKMDEKAKRNSLPGALSSTDESGRRWENVTQVTLPTNNPAWSDVATLEPGKYRITATGEYKVAVSTGHTVWHENVSHCGYGKETTNQRDLLFPQFWAGEVVLWHEGVATALCREAIITINKKGVVQGTVNLAHIGYNGKGWEENYKNNRGTIPIRVEKALDDF